MNSEDLLIREHLEPLRRPFKSLSQVLASLIFTVGLQLDGMEALFTIGQQF
ncbi:hypothetical protein D9M68_698910 [compost metagenome]